MILTPVYNPLHGYFSMTQKETGNSTAMQHEIFYGPNSTRNIKTRSMELLRAFTGRKRIMIVWILPLITPWKNWRFIMYPCWTILQKPVVEIIRRQAIAAPS